MSHTARCEFCGKGPFPTHAGLSKHIQRTSACRESSKKELEQYIANIQQATNPHIFIESLHAPDSDPNPDLNPTIIDAEIDASDSITSLGPTVEDVPRNPLHPRIPGNTYFIETYPAEARAGAAWGTGTPKFQAIHKEIGKDWGPFEDEDEWQMAEWLIKNVGQTQTDKFLKLPIVSRFSWLSRVVI